jgi:cell division FtsZ-interacting protein ZapD
MLPNDFVYASDDWKLDESQLLMFNTQIEELMKQSEEQQTNYELELARVEAKYQAEVAELKRQLEQKANEEENVQRVEFTPSHPKQGQSLMIDEMVKHVKQRFSKSAAEEFCTMYYHLAMEHGGLDEETSKLVDSIVPAILQRDVPQHTLNIDTATQVNLGPKEVNNYIKEE